MQENKISRNEVHTPILGRISENLSIYIIELNKSRPLQWLCFEKRKPRIWLSPSNIPSLAIANRISKSMNAIRKFESK